MISKSVWALIGYGVLRGTGLLGSLLFARHLGPNDFGYIAIGLLVIQAVSIAVDSGVGAWLISTDRNIDEIARICFGLMLLLGVVAAILCALAGELLSLFGEGLLGHLMLGLSLIFPMGSVLWFLTSLFRREMRFKTVAFAQIAQGIVQLVLVAVFIQLGGGVLTLAISTAAGYFVGGFMLWWRWRWTLPVFARADAAFVLSRSRAFLAQSVMGFVNQNLDTMSVALASGVAGGTTGGYSASYKVADLPYQSLIGPVSQVVFTRISSLRRDRLDPFRFFSLCYRVLTYVSSLMSFVMLFAAKPVLEVLFGVEWTKYSSLLVALGVWSLVRAPQSTLGWALNAMGHAGFMARLDFYVLLISVPSFLFAAFQFGGIGVAYTLAAFTLISFCGMLTVSVKELRWPLAELVRPLGSVLVGVVVMTCIWAIASRYGVGLGAAPILLVILVLLTTLIVLLIVLCVTDGRFLVSVIALHWRAN